MNSYSKMYGNTVEKYRKKNHKAVKLTTQILEGNETQQCLKMKSG